jgi:hypothetical protein
MVFESLGMKLRRIFGGKSDASKEEPANNETLVPGTLGNVQTSPSSVLPFHQKQDPITVIREFPKEPAIGKNSPIIDQSPTNKSSGPDRNPMNDVPPLKPVQSEAKASPQIPLGGTSAVTDPVKRTVATSAKNAKEAKLGDNKLHSDPATMTVNPNQRVMNSDASPSINGVITAPESNGPVKRGARKSEKTVEQASNGQLTKAAPKRSKRTKPEEKVVKAKAEVAKDSKGDVEVPILVAAAPAQNEKND